MNKNTNYFSSVSRFSSRLARSNFSTRALFSISVHFSLRRLVRRAMSCRTYVTSSIFNPLFADFLQNLLNIFVDVFNISAHYLYIGFVLSGRHTAFVLQSLNRYTLSLLLAVQFAIGINHPNNHTQYRNPYRYPPNYCFLVVHCFPLSKIFLLSLLK